MDMKTARAPYNFVPIANQIIWRYKDAADLPGHDVLDPQLLSGEIRVTVTAKTPIYIAGRERTGFVKDARGRYIIPGSSLRGLLRQNMQILGMGQIRSTEDMKDTRLLYRDMTSAKEAVNHSLRDRYVAVLGIRTVGPKRTVATAVSGGYLHNNGGEYAIAPTAAPVIHIKRKEPVVANWSNRYAFQQSVWYRLSGSKVADIQQTATDGYLRGVLLSPGLMRNQNRLYLFPAENPEARVDPLSPEEVLAYQEDVKMKRNGLKGTDRAHPMDPEFWELPEPGGVKAVFYAKDSEGFTSFGTSQFLRIGYAHSLGYGLPEEHRSKENAGLLDYPSSMFGYSRGDVSFRSRISVGNLVAEGEPKPMSPIPIMLGGPKPSFIAAYSQKGKDYNRDDFRLSGIKQYWLKLEYAPELPNYRPDNNKDGMVSKLHPLEAGTKFVGTIRYRNLHEDELGLLLWCLRLDPGCFQNMGMGKPYGFGRVKIEIDALREFDIQNLYRDLTAGAVQRGTTADRVDELIRAYDTYACEQPDIKPENGEATLRGRDHIKDFLYMKATIRRKEEHPYMSPREHRNIQDPLPAVADIRTGAVKEKLQVQPPRSQPQKPGIDPTDWKAMVAARNALNAANTANSSFGKKKKGKL